jgi:hypothetical protein
LLYIFCLLPAASALEANTSVKRLHYVLIYISYNEILLLLHLCYCYANISYLSCERLRMARLDDCSILQPGHLVESRLGGMHNSFSIQNLSISWLCMLKCQAMCRTTNEHYVCLDLREARVSRRTRYPCNSGRSKSSNVWSGEPRLYVV